MSQAKNKVNWCLNKAKKELNEGTSHRGLVKTESDIENAKKHIAKAEHNFKAVLVLERARLTDWAVSAVFYTVYHCLLGIILKFGYQSRNQECTIALIENLVEEKIITLDKSILTAMKNVDNEEAQERTIIQLRENFQYGTQTELEDKQLTELKTLCKTVLAQAKDIIYK